MTEVLLAEIEILKRENAKYKQAIEDIKAEIEKQKHTYCCNTEMMSQNIAYDTVLAIIDKHIESEDKE